MFYGTEFLSRIFQLQLRVNTPTLGQWWGYFLHSAKVATIYGPPTSTLPYSDDRNIVSWVLFYNVYWSPIGYCNDPQLDFYWTWGLNTISLWTPRVTNFAFVSWHYFVNRQSNNDGMLDQHVCILDHITSFVGWACSICLLIVHLDIHSFIT